jgi:hypothetical protein
MLTNSQLLRQHQLAVSVAQPITALPSQFFNFEINGKGDR